MTTADWDGPFGEGTVKPSELTWDRAAVTARRVSGSLSRWLTASRPVAAWVPVCAGLSPMLLTIAWLIGDELQPRAYSPVRQTVSVLAGQAATDRWLVTGALYIIGVCHFATAAGLGALNLRARIGLVVTGLAAIGIAASPEPIAGGRAQHVVFTAIGAVALTVWPLLAAQRLTPASILVSARVSAVASLGFLILLCWTAVETQNGATLGLAERVSSTIQSGWPLAVAMSLRRHARTDHGAR
jgi:hypothetical protein